MTQKMHPAYQIWKIIIPMSSNNVDSHRQLETWEYPTTHLLVTHLFVLIKMRDLLVGLLLLSVKKIHMVIIWTFFFSVNRTYHFEDRSWKIFRKTNWFWLLSLFSKIFGTKITIDWPNLPYISGSLKHWSVIKKLTCGMVALSIALCKK